MTPCLICERASSPCWSKWRRGRVAGGSAERSVSVKKKKPLPNPHTLGLGFEITPSLIPFSSISRKEKIASATPPAHNHNSKRTKALPLQHDASSWGGSRDSLLLRHGLTHTSARLDPAPFYLHSDAGRAPLHHHPRRRRRDDHGGWREGPCSCSVSRRGALVVVVKYFLFLTHRLTTRLLSLCRRCRRSRSRRRRRRRAAAPTTARRARHHRLLHHFSSVTRWPPRIQGERRSCYSAPPPPEGLDRSGCFEGARREASDAAPTFRSASVYQHHGRRRRPRRRRRRPRRRRRRGASRLGAISDADAHVTPPRVAARR